jgi:hypothetical protein
MMGYAYILTHPGTVSFQVWTSRDTQVVLLVGWEHRFLVYFFTDVLTMLMREIGGSVQV